MDHSIHHLCHTEAMSEVMERVVSVVFLNAKLERNKTRTFHRNCHDYKPSFLKMSKAVTINVINANIKRELRIQLRRNKIHTTVNYIFRNV